ncbi:MAG: FAD:protein FMN transferase [Myxococcota bacterium]
MMLAALLAGACAPPPPAVHALRGEALGTTWSVKWRGDRPTEPDAEAAVVRVLGEVDAAMSSWRDDSELAAIRSSHGPVVVSEETYEVVGAALELADATRGAFDPTVEPLMALWGFRGAPRTEPPTDDEIAAARAQVGWQRVRRFRGPDGAPRIDGGGTSLDLSAIAKGHAVDRVANALSALGAADQLVEVGGEVRAQGDGPQGAWQLGVDEPEPGHAPGQALAAVVGLTNAALATSGNYRSRYEADGTVIVHTMDPRTGRPFDSVVGSASVVAPDCRTADGWATALMVLGEAGLPLVEARPDLEALLLVGGREVPTSGFPSR